MVKLMNSCSLTFSNSDAFCNNLCILFMTVAAFCNKSGKGAPARKSLNKAKGRKNGIFTQNQDKCIINSNLKSRKGIRE